MPSFLHAADLHLDSPLRGLDAREGAPAERIRKASRIALERMVDAALERGVDFVLLAGDIYDTRPAFETYLFFHGQMARLSKAGIPVAMVLGNHDHGGASPRAERLPEGVRVLSAEAPESIEIVDGVWVHGQSYPTRDIAVDLTGRYPAAVPGVLNIGLLHTALDGYSGEHAAYAPSNTERLASHGYDYWALGHVHQRHQLHVRGCHIVYPGNLQGRHVRETGAKGAVFVEYGDGRIGDIGFREFDDVRWHRLGVDPATLDPDSGVDLVKQVAQRVLDDTGECRAAGRLAAVRLRVAGEAPPALVELGEEEIRESLRAEFSTRDDLFLEKVELALRVPAANRQEVDGYLAGLLQRMEGSEGVARALDGVRRDLLAELRKAGGPELVEAFQASLGDGPGLDDALALLRELLLSGGGRGR